MPTSNRITGMGFDYAIFDELMEEHEALESEILYADRAHESAVDRWLEQYLEREIEENKLVIHVGGE